MPDSDSNTAESLGRILASVFGISPRPYDTETQLWEKVARSINLRVSGYDSLEDVLSKIAAASPKGAGVLPPLAPARITASNLPDISNLVGLFSYNNAESLPGVTDLNILAESNREGFDFLQFGASTVAFPNLTTMTGGGYISIISGVNLTSLTFPKLKSVEFSSLTVSQNPLLTSLAFPEWESSGTIAIVDNASLVSLSIPKLVFAGIHTFGGNALDAVSVNHILARAVANPAYTTGQLTLNGGTNAAPTGQGIVDKGVLVARGVTVLTN